MRRLSLAALLCLTSLDLPAEVLLEEIVVTGTRTEKLLHVSPYSTGLISDEAIRRSFDDQLADLVASLPGVLVSDAGQAGQKRIRIRGEEARRVALLIDGQEFLDHREVGVPLLVDVNRIRRIEVVRGPASVLYGPRAMGGVINVITKPEANDVPTLDMNLDYNSSTDGHGVGVQGAMPLTDTLSLAGGAFENRHELRETPAGTLDNTAYNSSGFNLSANYLAGEHSYTLAYEDYRSDAEVYVEDHIRFTPPFRDFIIDVPQRDREKLRFDYRYQPLGNWLQSVVVDAYRQESQRGFNTFPMMALAPGLNVDTTIITDSELVSDGINLQTDWLLGDRVSLVAGVQWVEDEIDQQRDRQVETNGLLTQSERQLDNAELRSTAAYAQFDVELNDRLSLLAGSRSYRVDGGMLHTSRAGNPGDFDDRHTVTSTALVFSPSSQHVFRLNFAEGYIYPSLLNLVVGAYAGSSFVHPVPDLESETSKTFELGYRFSGSRWMLDATAFYTRARDYIDHVPCVTADACPGARDRIYRNINRADTHGMELAFQWRGDSVSLEGTATWLQRKKDLGDVSTYDSGVSPLTGRLSLTHDGSLLGKALTTTLTGHFERGASELVATRRGFTTENNPGFATFDIAWHLEMSHTTHLGLMIANLADRQYHSITENLYAPGRHLRINLRYGF